MFIPTRKPEERLDVRRLDDDVKKLRRRLDPIRATYRIWEESPSNDDAMVMSVLQLVLVIEQKQFQISIVQGRPDKNGRPDSRLPTV
jgi:hypothetical protein